MNKNLWVFNFQFVDSIIYLHMYMYIHIVKLKTKQRTFQKITGDRKRFKIETSFNTQIKILNLD